MKPSTRDIEGRLRDGDPVFSATFNMRVKHYDEEFHRLNDRIDEIAKASPGYLGKEYWANDTENMESVIYYWESLESLKQFSNHPDHRDAKRQYQKWYSGYEIIISRVLSHRTDGGL